MSQCQRMFLEECSERRELVNHAATKLDSTHRISLINPDSMACSWLRHIAIAVFIL